MRTRLAPWVAAGFVTALFGLGGCATPADLGPTPTMRNLADIPMASLAESGADADWPTETWWTAYGDPQLDLLMAAGLAGSPDLAQASARLRRAAALANLTQAALTPAIGVTASASLLQPSEATGIPVAAERQGVNDYGRVTTGLDWDLDLWGRNRAAVAAAMSEARAVEAEQAAARLALTTGIAGAWADLVRLYRDRDAIEEILVIRRGSLDLVELRVAAGLDSQAELTLAQAGPPAAEAELAAADEALALTRTRIAVLAGLGPDAAADILRPTGRAPTSIGLPRDLPLALISRRPDLVAARWRADAAAHRIDQSVAAFYPNVNLAALIGMDALRLENLTSGPAVLGSLAPVLSLPIFDGGRRRAGQAMASADYDLAVANYDDTLLRALGEVSDAVQSARQLSVRLAASRAALDANARAYDIARFRYEQGVADYQSVLVVEDRLVASRRAVATLETRAFTLDVALVRGLGGGVPVPTGPSGAGA